MGVIEDNAARLSTFDDAMDSPERVRNVQLALEQSACAGFYGAPQEMLQAWKKATQTIKEPHKELFTHAEHQRFAQWIAQHIQDNPFVDAQSVVAAAKDEDKIEYFGGLKQLLSYSSYFFSIDSSKSALEKLIQRRSRHLFAEFAAKAVDDCQQGKRLDQCVFELIKQTKPLVTVETKLYQPTEDIVTNALEQLTNNDSNQHFVPSYFSTAAELWGQSQRGQIIMVGAPTGNGKTAWALDEVDFSLDNGLSVALFGMETSFRQYLSRRIARRHAIPIFKFNKKGLLSDEDLKICREEADVVKGLGDRFFMSKNESYSALEIDAMIQEMKQKTGRPVDLIVVDHLNTMKPLRPGTSSSDYNHWVETTQELQDIAARENATLLLLAQLTTEAVRSSFTNSGKLPTIGAFRGGAPTEKAKVCVILHKADQAMLSNCPVVEQKIIIVKANDGSCGTVDSLFLGPFTKHIEDVPPLSTVTGRRIDLGAYRKAKYGKWLQRLGFDPETPRGGNDN